MAQDYDAWIGKNLIITRQGVQLKALDPATGKTSIIGDVKEAEVRLEKVQGKWLWVRTSTGQGWITRADAVPPDQAPNHFTEKLRGTWVCVVTLKEGEAVEDYIGVRAVIDGDNLTWLFPEQDGKYREQKCKFRIDSSKDPKRFDWWQPAKPDSPDLRIFAVGENLLRWGTNGDRKTRPATFDSARWQFTMKRVIASGEKPRTEFPITEE